MASGRSLAQAVYGHQSFWVVQGGLGPSGCLVAMFANLRERRGPVWSLFPLLCTGAPVQNFWLCFCCWCSLPSFLLMFIQLQGWGFHGSHCLFPSNLHQSYISQFALFVFQ